MIGLTKGEYNLTEYIVCCFIVIAILTRCSIVLYVAYRQLRKHNVELQKNYKNLEKLNSELRSQRHDYLNHLQVVYGLMELEEYEELRNYFEPVYKAIQKTGKALKTSRPAINALLKAKMDEAQRRGIDFYVEVKTDLKEIGVEDWELCKVISNIVDNAMTAVEENADTKKIVLDMTEDKTHYRFAVSNNGPKIPEHMQSEIFKQGITSMKEEGHGMGLYIVTSIVKEYEGTLQLRSTDDETVFGFAFPKKAGETNG